MTLVSFLRSIDFEDANLCGVLSTLQGEQTNDTRLAFHTQTVHLVGKRQILLQVLRIDFDFTDTD